MAELPAAALLAAEHALSEVLLTATDGHDAFRRGMAAMAPMLGWDAAALWTPAHPERPAVEWPGPAVGWTPRPPAEAPVWGGDRVWFGLVGVAAVEARFPVPPDPSPALDATLISLSRRVAHFVAQRDAQARLRAILDSGLDCVVTIDREGRVLEANRALETLFGHDPVAAVGRELAELVVPPDLRERHREGLRRLAAGDAPRLLGRRVELEAQTAAGARLPVELLITAIDAPGRAAYTGHIRDLSGLRRTEEALRESRHRVVTAADAARRRFERDLHDGAQQRLVALALTLRLARRRLPDDPASAEALLVEAQDDLDAATAELRELARGIHPAVLTDAGLETAIESVARRAAIRVETDIAVTGRLPESVEAAAYFAIAEGILNAGRHSRADVVRVSAWVEDGALRFRVRDDGAGGASLDAGSGLSGLADRLAAANGELRVLSPPGGGTTLEGVVPILRFVG